MVDTSGVQVEESLGLAPTTSRGTHGHSSNFNPPHHACMQPASLRVFSIAEMATHIVQTLQVDNYDRSETATQNAATLAALARVCSVVSKVALDQLWLSLCTVDPLVRLLPSDAYELSDYFNDLVSHFSRHDILAPE